MTDWLHSPLHRFDSRGTYMVTGATYKKEHMFKKNEDLDLVENTLLELLNYYQW